MKTVYIFLFLLVILSSCDDDNDVNIDNPFLGEWHLISLTGGFSPTETYQVGDIIWGFNSDDSLEIEISTNISNQSRLPIKNDTTLSYSYDSLHLVVGNNNYEYRLENNDSTLKLYDELASDGIMMELEKH